MDSSNSDCPPPPLDNLKPAARGATALAIATGAFDRKGGNPGPKVVPFGEQTKQGEKGQPIEPTDGQNEPTTMATDGGVSTKYGNSLAPEQRATLQQAVLELVTIFPTVEEDWLERCAYARIIVDKWTLVRTISYIFEFENLAPRKEGKQKFTGDFSRAKDYNSYKMMLNDIRPENPSPDYMFYAALELSQKFPQFSMFSLRQTLQDFGYAYPATVFAIVEGLEREMLSSQKTWKQWQRHEIIFITAHRGSKLYKYPLCVVKGEKTWSKKKAFPAALIREIRLVEKALYSFEERYHKLKSRLDAEEMRRQQLEKAVLLNYAMDCGICFDKFLPEEAVGCSNRDEYCVFCLYRSIDEALGGQLTLSPNGDIPCLIPGCEGVFPLSALCHLLPGDLLTRLEERLWTDLLARAQISNLVTCYGCGYAEQVDVPVSELKLFERKNPKCLRRWCRSCKNLWDNHGGKSCEEMRGDPEDVLRKKYDEMLTDVTVRRCHKCSRRIQKTSGCNKMECQWKMCYLCRKPISGYEHFCRHPTTPGKDCEQCAGCKLWVNTDAVDEELRRRLLYQMQEELLELKLAYAGKKAASAAATPKTPSSGLQDPSAADSKPRQAVADPARQFAAVFGFPRS